MEFRPMLGAETMARPTKSKATPVEPPDNDRVAIIHLKGSPEYAAWLERLHKETHIAKTNLVRLALKEWAENRKHESPPEL
jgi:hypothetical protein